MLLRVGVASHRGLVRETNEDSFLVKQGLYAVCDGMGGARGGEVASQMACQALLELDPSETDEKKLGETIAAANVAVVSRSLSDPQLAGMGTTLTVAVAREDAFLLGHVGDSRAYLLHEGKLLQLTADHSWVGEMLRRGEITQAEAAVHPHRSIITRALGTDLELEPDLFTVPFAPGDRLLLCSDGLSGMLSDEEIAELLKSPDHPQAVAESLVRAALTAGGEDNVTVVVVQGVEDVAGSEEGRISSAGDGDARDEIGVLLGPRDRGEEQVESVAAGRPKRPGLAWQRLRKGPPPGGRVPETRAGLEAAKRPIRRLVTRRRVIAAAVVLVVAALVGGFAAFNSSVYYVGTHEGMVALYRGLPGSLLGIELSSVVEIGTVSYDSLAPYLRERVDAHDLLSKEEGRAFLKTLGTLP